MAVYDPETGGSVNPKLVPGTKNYEANKKKNAKQNRIDAAISQIRKDYATQPDQIVISGPDTYQYNAGQEVLRNANRAEAIGMRDRIASAINEMESQAKYDAGEVERRRIATGRDYTSSLVSEEEKAKFGPTAVAEANAARIEAETKPTKEIPAFAMRPVGGRGVSTTTNMTTQISAISADSIASLKNDYDKSVFITANFPAVKEAQLKSGLSDKEIRDSTNFTLAVGAAGLIAQSYADPARQTSLLNMLSEPQKALVYDIINTVQKDYENTAKNNEAMGKSAGGSALGFLGMIGSWANDSLMWLNENSQHVIRANMVSMNALTSEGHGLNPIEAWDQSSRGYYNHEGLKWAREKYGAKPVDLIVEFRDAQRNGEQDLIGSMLDKYQDDPEALSIIDQLINGWNYNQDMLDLATYIDTIDQGDFGNLMAWGLSSVLVDKNDPNRQQEYFDIANSMAFTGVRNTASVVGTVTFDPTLALGKVRNAYYTARYGIGKLAIAEGIGPGAGIAKMMKKRAVKDYFTYLGKRLEQINKAPVTKQAEMFNSLSAQERKWFDAKSLVAMEKGLAANGDFGPQGFVKYFQDGLNVEAILTGQAARRGTQLTVPHANILAIAAKEAAFKARGLTWAKNGAEVLDVVFGSGTAKALDNAIDRYNIEQAGLPNTPENVARLSEQRIAVRKNAISMLADAFTDDADAIRKSEFLSQFVMQNGEAQYTWFRNFIEKVVHLGSISKKDQIVQDLEGGFGSARTRASLARYGFKKKKGVRQTAERVSRTMSHMPSQAEPWNIYDGPGLKSADQEVRNTLLYGGMSRYWANFVRYAWLNGTPAQRYNIATGIVKTFSYAGGIHILDPENARKHVAGLIGSLSGDQTYAPNLFDEQALSSVASRIYDSESAAVKNYVVGRGGEYQSPLAAEAKNLYREKYNIVDASPEVDYTQVKVDRKLADEIAKEYEKLPAYDKTAEPYYDALIAETEQQYRFMTEDLGIRVEFVDTDPYKNSTEMMQDVINNKTLKVYRTGEGQGHPYMTNQQNDMFRAVHDFFGHAATGMQFGQKGEEAAWIAHSSMFSKMAQRALTTETRGQNSWVNQSAHQAIPPAERPFAKQKFALLPEKYSQIPNYAPSNPRTIAEIESNLRAQIAENSITSPELSAAIDEVMSNAGRFKDASGKITSSAVFLGQTSPHVNMPDFTKLAQINMRSSVMQMLLGNNAGMNTITDLWVAGTLLGPRFQMRSGIEDVVFYGLTGGSWRRFAKGRKMSQAMRTALGQKLGFIRTMFDNFVTVEEKVAARKAWAAGDRKTLVVLTKKTIFRKRMKFSGNNTLEKLADPTNPYNLTKQGKQEQAWLDSLIIHGGDDAFGSMSEVSETASGIINGASIGSADEAVDIQKKLIDKTSQVTIGYGRKRKNVVGQTGRYVTKNFNAEDYHAYDDVVQNLRFATWTDGPKGQEAIVLIKEWDAAKRITNATQRAVEQDRIVKLLADVIRSYDSEYGYTKFLAHGEREGAEGLARRTLDAVLPTFRDIQNNFIDDLYNKVVKNTTINGVPTKMVDYNAINVDMVKSLKTKPGRIYGKSVTVVSNQPRDWFTLNKMWDKTGRSLARMTREPIFIANYLESRAAIKPLEDKLAETVGSVAADRWATRISMDRSVQSSLAWVDNPNNRSQLAWNLRNVARFYRAAEDFNRRMLRITKNQPMAYWKAAIAWNIIDDSGFVHTDENGEKYVVWPMLGPAFSLMNAVTSKVFGSPMLGLDNSIAFSSKATMFTPSADPNSWIPTFSGPFAALALKPVMRRLPLVSSMEDEFFGEYSEGQPLWRSITPPNLQRIVDALITDNAQNASDQAQPLERKFDSQYNSVFASNARQAMQLYYNTIDFDPEQGFKSEVDVEQARTAIDRIAMDLMWFKVATGFFLPASSQSFVNNTTAFAKSLGYQGLRPAFTELMRKYDGDVDKAMTLFYKTNPKLSIWTIGTTGNERSVGFWNPGSETTKFIEKNKEEVSKNKFGMSMFAPEEITYGTYAQFQYLQSMGLKVNKSVEQSFQEIFNARGYMDYVRGMAAYRQDVIENGKAVADSNKSQFMDELYTQYPDLEKRISGMNAPLTASEYDNYINDIDRAANYLESHGQASDQTKLFKEAIAVYRMYKNDLDNTNDNKKESEIRSAWTQSVQKDVAENERSDQYLKLLDYLSGGLDANIRVGR